MMSRTPARLGCSRRAQMRIASSRVGYLLPLPPATTSRLRSPHIQT